MANITAFLQDSDEAEWSSLNTSWDEPLPNFTENASPGSLNGALRRYTGRLQPNILVLFFYLSRTFTAVFSLTGILINCCVFKAVRKISPQTLKSKTFIQNAIISDICLCLGYILITFGYMIEGFRTPKTVHLTIRHLNRHLSTLTFYIQAFASLLLVLDRMYAVVKPMTYHTTGYSKIAKVSLLLFSWLSPIALMLTGLIIPFTKEVHARKPIYRKFSVAFHEFTNDAKPAVSIGMNVSIFVLYITLFIVFIVQRKTNRAVEGSTSDRGGTTLSLTVTYFMIHTTSLSLYLPGPIMKVFRDNLLLPKGVPPLVWQIVNQVLVILYVCNATVNPIILGSRVRLVREGLRQMLGRKNLNTPPKHQVTATKITEFKSASIKK